MRTRLNDSLPPSCPGPFCPSFYGSDTRDQGVDVKKPEAELPGDGIEREGTGVFPERNEEERPTSGGFMGLDKWQDRVILCQALVPPEARLIWVPVLV